MLILIVVIGDSRNWIFIQSFISMISIIIAVQIVLSLLHKYIHCIYNNHIINSRFPMYFCENSHKVLKPFNKSLRTRKTRLNALVTCVRIVYQVNVLTHIM